jgi:hypothetical protein
VIHARPSAIGAIPALPSPPNTQGTASESQSGARINCGYFGSDYYMVHAATR